MAYAPGTRSELFPSIASTSTLSGGMEISPADSVGASAARPSLRDTIMSRTTAASVVVPSAGHSSWSADAVLDPFVDPPMPGARPPSAAMAVWSARRTEWPM